MDLPKKELGRDEYEPEECELGPREEDEREEE